MCQSKIPEIGITGEEYEACPYLLQIYFDIRGYFEISVLKIMRVSCSFFIFAGRIYRCLFTGSVSSLLTLPLDMLST